MRSRWRLILGIAVSALFVSIAVQGLDFGQFATHLKDAEYVWLLPGIGVYFMGVWARTWRWHYMLRHIQDISMPALFRIVCIGYMGNNIYPFRAGELLRSYVLREREGIPISSSIATVIVERVFDGLVMLIFVFAALPFAPLPDDSIRNVVTIASGGFFVAIVTFFVMAAMPTC